MSRKARILAVDDEPRNLKIVSLALNGEWELQSAKSGEEALQLVATFQPDVVLLDIMMPGIDGYEVTRRLRSDAKWPFLKIVLVSGKAMIEERLKGYEAGADDYISKPFVPEELSSKVRVFARLALAEADLHHLNRDLEGQVQERTRELLQTQAKMISHAKMAALGEMAGGMAHEINTPLTTISMVSEQIIEMLEQNRPEDRESLLKMAKLAHGTSMHIAKIIQGLRNFARDGKNDPCEPRELGALLAEIRPLCGARLRDGTIKLEIESAPDLIVSCRSIHLLQVLVNLISNAVDAVHGSAQPWVRVTAEADGENARIRITDSGKGIPPDLRDRIFEPFFTTKDVGRGTGIGLSLSKGLIEEQGGTLTLNGDHPNTQFVITLPLVQLGAGSSTAA